MRSTLTVLAVLLCGGLAGGCQAIRGTDAHVRSDTSWSGFFQDRTIDGRGDQTISLGNGTESKCVSVQKQTREGFLTVRVDGGEEQTTYAPFGVVAVCGGAGL